MKLIRRSHHRRMSHRRLECSAGSDDDVIRMLCELSGWLVLPEILLKNRIGEARPGHGRRYHMVKINNPYVAKK